MENTFIRMHTETGEAEGEKTAAIFYKHFASVENKNVDISLETSLFGYNFVEITR